MAKGFSSLSGVFGKAGRRLLLTAFVSTTALHTEAQTSPGTLIHKTEVSTPSPFAMAKKNYLTMLRAANNSYSARLDSIERGLTDYLRRNDTCYHNGVIMMDPLKFDVARALGFTTKEAVSMLIEEKSATSKTVLGLSSVEKNMALEFSSIYGDESYTQTPLALLNKANTPQSPRIAIIIPMPRHAMPFSVPEMGNAAFIEYADRHEGWHTLDALTNFNGIDSRYMSAAYSRLTFYNEILLYSRDARLFAAAKLQQESIADVGALGDMIADGHDTAIIGKIIHWRERTGMMDGWHMTVLSLQGLQNKLEETGLEKFREMNEKERRDLYIGIVRENCPSAEGIKIMLRFHAGSPETRSALQKIALKDSETRKALAFEKALCGVIREEPSLESLKAIGEARKKSRAEIRRKLDNWDALQELRETALKNDGALTPESVIRAYGALMDTLGAQAVRLPDQETLCRAKMTRLQSLFVRNFARMDFESPEIGTTPPVSVPVRRAPAQDLKQGKH